MAAAVAGRPRPAAPPRLAELLDSGDRPAIQADISLNRGVADDHIAALIEVARKRRAEPIDPG